MTAVNVTCTIDFEAKSFSIESDSPAFEFFENAYREIDEDPPEIIASLDPSSEEGALDEIVVADPLAWASAPTFPTPCDKVEAEFEAKVSAVEFLLNDLREP